MISAHLASAPTHLSGSSTFHTAGHSLNPSQPQRSVQKRPTVSSVSAPTVYSILSSLYYICPHFPPLEFTPLSAFKYCAGLPQNCHCNSLKENQSRSVGDQIEVILTWIRLPPPFHSLSDLFFSPSTEDHMFNLTKDWPLTQKSCCWSHFLDIKRQFYPNQQTSLAQRGQKMIYKPFFIPLILGCMAMNNQKHNAQTNFQLFFLN